MTLGWIFNVDSLPLAWTSAQFAHAELNSVKFRQCGVDQSLTLHYVKSSPLRTSLIWVQVQDPDFAFGAY